MLKLFFAIFASVAVMLALAVPETVGFEQIPYLRIEPASILVEKNALYPNELAKNWSTFSAIFGKDLTLKFGQLKVDTGVNYLRGTFAKSLADAGPEFREWSSSLNFAADFGLGLLTIGAFHLEDMDNSDSLRREQTPFRSLDDKIESMLLLIGKKIDMRWNRYDFMDATLTQFTGNRMFRSGFESLYLCTSFNISERTKASALFVIVQANEMKWADIFDGTVQRFDVSFEWALTDNLTYAIDAGYFKFNDHFKGNTEAFDGKDLDPYAYGFHHDFVIRW
jgi:hypothetical protein